MAATDEEKAAKAEDKRLADAAEEEKKTREAAANSVGAAEAEAKAKAEQAVQDQLKEQTERGEAARESDTEEFAGQFLSSDNFSVVTTEHLGRAVLELRPAGWVGEGTIIAASRVQEVADLLGKVKNLPKE